MRSEATKALKHYFNSRKLNGEELTPESPVFANHSKSNRKKQEYFGPRSLRLLLTKLLFASGIEREKTGKRYDKAVLYGFRKRFNTILKLNNDVNSNIAEKLMAHRNGLDVAYLKPTKEQCFFEFQKDILDLTISDDYRQKFKIVELEKDKSEIENLRDEVSRLRDTGDLSQRYINRVKQDQKAKREIIKSFGQKITQGWIQIINEAPDGIRLKAKMLK